MSVEKDYSELIKQSWQAQRAGRYKQSLSVLGDARPNNPKFLIRLAWAQSLNGRLDEAEKTIKLAQVFALDESDKAACYVALGRTLRNAASETIALAYYVSAIEHYRRADDMEGGAVARIYLACARLWNGNYNDTLRLLDEALPYVDDAYYQAMIYRYWGIAEAYKGSFVEAIKCLQDSAELYRSLDNQVELAAALNNLGLAHMNMSSFDKALPYLREAVTIYARDGRKANYIVALQELIKCLNLLGKDREAGIYVVTMRHALRDCTPNELAVCQSAVHWPETVALLLNQ